MVYTNPIYGFLNTLLLFITGRVYFFRKDIGKIIKMRDEEEFKIFRRVEIKHYFNTRDKPEALFIIRFKPRMKIINNIRLSRIMLLIFMGFKGFRSKYWCVNERTGMCQGIYEWDKLKDAKRYSQSIAIKNMTKRSIPGSISFEILYNSNSNRTWKIIDKRKGEL